MCVSEQFDQIHVYLRYGWCFKETESDNLHISRCDYKPNTSNKNCRLLRSQQSQIKSERGTWCVNSHYCDPQLRVGEKYSHNLWPNIAYILCQTLLVIQPWWFIWEPYPSSVELLRANLTYGQDYELPCKHDTLTQCWVNFGPTSETAGHY